MNKIIDGLTTEYTEYGCENEETVFLLHGWGSNKELYAPVCNTLSAKYHAVAFDLPGFGGTDEPSEAWDVDRFADFCIAFIASFNVSKAILIGHSHGGRIIIKIANRSLLPFEIDKLVLIDSAGIPPRRGIAYKMRTGTYKFAKSLLLCPPVKKLFPDALGKMQKKMGSADYAAASPVMRASLVKVVNEDLTSLLPRIKQDTLLIWGEDDDATPISDGEKMEKLISSSGLARISGAGHFSWLDNPCVFSAIIKSYFRIN